jgi:heme-degrading monooxygenase HmoA
VIVILFRSKLTNLAADDYAALDAELEQRVKSNPGFLEVKAFLAPDGERLTVVWWPDRESLLKWQEDLRHQTAKNNGRKICYEYYKMEIAEVFRESVFQRREPTLT